MARYGPTVALGVRPSWKGSVRKPVPRCPERGWKGTVDDQRTSSGFMLTRHLRRRRSRTASGRCRGARCPTGRPAPSCPACAPGRVLADRPVPGGVRDRVVDRVLPEQRVAREVHLGDQPLGEGPAEQAEVDVRGAPRVVVVAPRVRAGLDGEELVAAQAVGDARGRARRSAGPAAPASCRRRAGSGRRRWPARPRPARRAPGGRRCRAPGRTPGSAGPRPRRRCARSGRRPGP